MTDGERFAARYPCSDDARAAAEAIDVSIGAVITGETDAVDAPAIVERAHDRVAAALTDGTVGRPIRDHGTELLSYPVARVLVSMLDDANAIGVYADAEAAAMRERIDADLLDDGAAVGRLLDAFGLDEHVRATADGYDVAVEHYLPIAVAMDDSEWALTERSLSDGVVPIESHEIAAFLERGGGERVRDGLPVDVPPSVRESVSGSVDALAALIRPVDAPTSIEGLIEPAAFPPCVRSLLRSARSGTLDERGRFAVIAFLGAFDVDGHVIAALIDGDAERIGKTLARLRFDASAEYVTPSCAGMISAGLCPGGDETCETIDHPGQYYVAKRDDSDAETTPQGGATS